MNDFVQGYHFVFDNGHLLWTKTLEHIQLSSEAMLIAVIIGVPLGVFLGHIHRFSFLAINVANIGRALPSLGVLAILLPVVGVGTTNVIIALVVLAAPPILTNAFVAVDQVDPEAVDAAKGIGLRPRQVLTKIEIPLALPLIFAGIRTSAVFVVATATLSGFFGGGGLGDIIGNAPSFHLAGVIGASYVLIILAFASQLLLFAVEKLITPPGLRKPRSTRTFLVRPRSRNAPQVGDDVDMASPLEPARLEQGSSSR
jgi:osmoprotectant transport system permease protein